MTAQLIIVFAVISPACEVRVETLLARLTKCSTIADGCQLRRVIDKVCADKIQNGAGLATAPD